ncbi:MAG: class I adenylate-forming enzyme family protein [Burkholderiaceae bacterium]
MSSANPDQAQAPFTSIPDSIRTVARRMPERLALLCGERSATWRELDSAVDRTAHHLAGLGVGKGDKVALLGVNSIEYLSAFLGALRAGAVVVPLSTMAAADALHRMIEDADTKAIFLSEHYYPSIAPIERELRGLVRGGKIALDFERDGWSAYAAALGTAPARPFEMPIEPNDEFNIIYSSGTTGLPKGIVHVHSMRSALAQRFAALGFTADSVSLVSTPMYGNFTLAGMLPTLAVGGMVILMQKFDALGFLELAQRHRVTHAMLVPVQYQRMLALPEFDRYDLSSFVTKFIASAPSAVSLKRAVLERWPGRLIELYGLTEGGPGTLLDATAFPDKLHTVGRAGLATTLKVLGPDDCELPAGEIGEVVGRSPLMMMKGYYKQPEKTREMIWVDAAGEVYYRSGDFGRIDEDGFLVLLDRKKDMIISGGFNVYASDVEAVLSQHPDVSEVAVIGVPSEAWGETPLALVVPRAGSDCSEQTLLAWANERLSKTARLSAVEFRGELPRSTLGKILKRELRAPYWNARS